MFFLGIETGERGSRGIVLDLEAAAVAAEAAVAPEFVGGLPGGHLEQKPSDWIAGVDRVARKCLDALGENGRGQVAGIGVAGSMEGLVALDGENGIVRPAKVAGDRSADRQSEMLARAFGGAPGLIELTGNPLLPWHTAPAALWLKQHEPYHFQKTETFFLPQDFINYWLTAVRRSEHSGASVTGMFDVRRRKWCRELLDWIDPRMAAMLPPLAAPFDPPGVLRKQMAEAWGLPRNTLVAAGMPDLQARMAAAGCMADGDLMVSLGGTAEIAGVGGAPLIDTRGEVAALCDAVGGWLAVMSMASGTATPELVRRHYGWSKKEFETMVAGAPAGAAGLTFLPYLEGERTPILPEGCGVLHGIDIDNFTPDNLTRAAVEGVALGIGYGLGRLRELGLEPTELRLTGPAAGSGMWRKILADVTGLPVTAPPAEHGPAMGAALQAAMTFFRQNGEDLSFAEISSHTIGQGAETRTEPDTELHEFYEKAISRQQYLVDTLHPAGFL
jgi:xylulokinase